MPDSKKGIEKECSHFYSFSEKEKTLQIPDLQEFSIKYQRYMQNPFVAGYAAHLYLQLILVSMRKLTIIIPNMLVMKRKQWQKSRNSKKILQI